MRFVLLFRFEGVIRKAVHEFKYKNLRAIASQLANLLERLYG